MQFDFVKRYPGSEQILKYHQLYLLEYAVVFVSFLTFAVTETKIKPRYSSKKFRLNDTSISKTYVENEIVGGGECILLSLIASIFVISWYCTFGWKHVKRLTQEWTSGRPEYISKRIHFAHVSFLALGLTVCLNGMLTNIFKLMIGNLRPDFISRCVPKSSALEAPDKYYTLAICEQSDLRLLFEGLKSTPSGHSSFITSGLGFAFIWQCKYVSTHFYAHLWCPIVIVLVMISRITDHRHHWYDVLSGCALGISIIYGVTKWISRPKYTLTALPK